MPDTSIARIFTETLPDAGHRAEPWRYDIEHHSQSSWGLRLMEPSRENRQLNNRDIVWWPHCQETSLKAIIQQSQGWPFPNKKRNILEKNNTALKYTIDFSLSVIFVCAKKTMLHLCRLWGVIIKWTPADLFVEQIISLWFSFLLYSMLWGKEIQ